MNQARVLALVVGISCLAIGAMLGWVASVQTSRGSGDGVGAAEAARADRVAAARAAVQAEGWARVANAAQTLAKGDNNQAQAARQQAQAARQQAQTARQQAEAARQQAREFADRAQKAAGRAAEIAAHVQKARLATAGTGTAVAARASATAAPRAAAAKPRPRVAAKPAAPPHLVAAAVVSAESCRRAAIFERTAASSSASREAAYNASVSGIAVNAHCPEPERSLIGAYLLAQRASAEIALKNGDWKSDLSRSDRVLSDCVRRPQHYGPIGRSCRARLTKNAKIRLAAH
jgi:multidrug efflux pump subunit AcrA (membrane-fusion protein)